MKTLVICCALVLATAGSGWAGTWTLTTTARQDEALDAAAEAQGITRAELLQNYYNGFISQWAEQARREKVKIACEDARKRADASAALGIDPCR